MKPPTRATVSTVRIGKVAEKDGITYCAKSANVAAWRFLRAMRVFAQSAGSGPRDLSIADTNYI
jgi:hypothetical protein